MLGSCARKWGCGVRRLLLLLLVLTALPFAEPVTGTSGPHPQAISLRDPVDFATGATPSSAAFNVTSGDQVHHLLARAPMSDGVTTGDFDRDGNPDVAQTNVIAGTVSILLGDGRGGFAAPRQLPVGTHPVFVVASDLDLDGKLDLAVANFGSGNVAILRGQGDGTFTPATFVAAPGARNVAIGWFNDDPLPDLAVAASPPGTGTLKTPNEPTPGGVAILLGTAVGTFVPAQFLRTTIDDRPVNANYVAAGDFNGDGRDDLAVGVGIRSNAGDRQAGDDKLTGDDALIFLSRHSQGAAPAPPFADLPDQRLRIGAWPAAVVVVDLNGDAPRDLAVLDAASGDVTTLLGDGTGRFTIGGLSVTVGALPRSLAAGDFDNDGRLDLVTASFIASTVSVLQGNGDGTLQPAVDFWAGNAPTSVAVGDFNLDGRADVASARLRDDTLALLLNDSPRPGDGVVVERDIPYVDTADDPHAAHHALDIYRPPQGTPSFAGGGRRYPVLFFAHGGGGISGDKTMYSLLMRSLAREGMVAVSTDYRLGPGLEADQVADVARAFRWTRDHVVSRERRADPDNLFVFGYSAGAGSAAKLFTGEQYGKELGGIRGLVLAGMGPDVKPGGAAPPPPSLLFNGDQGVEPVLTPNSASFAKACRDRGGESAHVVLPGRDHMTLVANFAIAGDQGREQLLSFMSRHLLLRPPATGAQPAAAAQPTTGAPPGTPLPATGVEGLPLALGLILLLAAAVGCRTAREPVPGSH